MRRSVKSVLELPPSDKAKTDRQFITSLARGLEVLRAFEPGDGMLGNLEIATRTGLPRPTIARITLTLTALGYLEYHERWEKYSLGAPVLSLGYACLGNMGIIKIARPHMQELANQVNLSVALGQRDRLSLAYLELAHGSTTVSLRLEVGARIPLAQSAMGAAYLHALPQTERVFLLSAIEKQHPEAFSEFMERFEQSCEDIETHGFCVSLGTYERTVNGAGAAFRLPRANSVYAFNCSGPSFQLGADRVRDEIGPALATMVRAIEVEFIKSGAA